MQIYIVFALPNEQQVLNLTTQNQITVEDAIKLSGILELYSEIDLNVNKVGIYGELVELGRIVEDQDRIEIYRPLKVDPKAARRMRATQDK